MNKHESREHSLHIFQGECLEKNLAVVRSTWFEDGKIVSVEESKIRDYEDCERNTRNFCVLVGTCLEMGADVSAYISCDPAYLGLKRS